MRLTTFLLVPLLLFYSLAYAQQEEKKHKIDIEQTRCLGKNENQTTAGMCDCTYKALEQWDKKLNEDYKKLLSALAPDAKNKLKEAQRQWVAFKEKEIELIDATYGAEEGTMWRIVRAGKVMEITRRRAIDIESLLALKQE